MPRAGSVNELSGYQPGTALDRVGMMARRAQLMQGQAQPQGLAGLEPEPQRPTAQAPEREQPKQPDRWAEVAARLWQKAIPAEVEVAPGVKSYARPGEGLIAYGDIPTSVTSKVPTDQAVLGWDPASLEPDEKFLLNYLVSLRQKERAASEQDFANDPRVRARAGLPPQGGSAR